MSENDTPASDLDAALAAAQDSPDRRADFYELFLRSELWVPTHEGDGEDQGIRPLLVESEGTAFLLLFDSAERLQAWAQQEVDAVRIQGAALAQGVDPRIHWLLNPGTERAKEFVPEEIAFLQQSLEERKMESREVPAGTEVRVSTAQKVPEGLEESLREVLSASPAVRDAYLAQVHYELEGETPHLALAASLDAAGEDAQKRLHFEIATAARRHLGQGEEIEIHLEEGDLSRKIIQVAEPFYQRDMAQ